MDIFHDWQPREIEAMQRATAWLRSIQPKKKKMSTTNDITGDSIQTKPASKDYRDGWERIYGSGTFQNGNNHDSDVVMPRERTLTRRNAGDDRDVASERDETPAGQDKPPYEDSL